ncbi:hypothetical protein K1T71_004251 [Dendrolimus kikuchii]|uniref:Uncharacterized protein n=1 Tax=Dendrolimus kikuchii TaxID=765133 RepID=A0ACC1D798_9NEOP|nr:hypothetical protein K1T71_004251 [Dendrolimus kikuchii]
MGRTKRKRRQKKPRTYYLCDQQDNLVLLNTWLAKNEMRRNRKLCLAVFDDTGRGVLCKNKIQAGEELINLPLNLTLNVTTILMDSIFCSIFLENKKQCLVEFEGSVSFQALMAFYLSYLKSQGEDSHWYIYIQNLPKLYTVPYFLPNEASQYIDSDILSVVSKQKDVIKMSFNIFEAILGSNVTETSNIKSFKKYFKLSIYEWAYFAVNTRCVYMDLSIVIDLKNIKNSIINLINDNTKISLCPYLDMINHSPNARNETKLVVSKNVENISIDNLREDLFADISFSIYTKNVFEMYSQVFICYGDSHNLKLVTEYGFYLPNNELDYVSFDFDSIKEFFTTKNIKLSREQVSFINSHNLDKDLYIDLKGLSFNFYGLLMVVKYFYSQSDVSRLIYSAAICSTDKNLNDLIMPTVLDKANNIKMSLNVLENLEHRSVILNNCIALMYQYVNILEKFIKC